MGTSKDDIEQRLKFLAVVDGKLVQIVHRGVAIEAMVMSDLRRDALVMTIERLPLVEFPWEYVAGAVAFGDGSLCFNERVGEADKMTWQAQQRSFDTFVDSVAAVPQ